MLACDLKYQLKLEESQANKMFAKCSSWCIYDFQSVRDNEKGGYIWQKEGCWKFVTKYHCFTDGRLDDFNVLVDKVSTICPGTIAPTTQSPTFCVDYALWSKEVADDTCSEGTWGSTNRGFESMLACDLKYQLKLEESQANKMFAKCSSWCIYDFQSVRDNEKGGYIWQKDGCWKFVTKYHCFTDSRLDDFNVLVDKVSTICPGTIA